ncbi:hypothetical protein CUS11_13255, partial [Enterococcus faecium]
MKKRVLIGTLICSWFSITCTSNVYAHPHLFKEKETVFYEGFFSFQCLDWQFEKNDGTKKIILTKY